MLYLLSYIYHIFIYALCFLVLLHISNSILFDFKFVRERFYFHYLYKIVIMKSSYYKKNICISMICIFMLYERFFNIVFTRHSAGNIWSSICMQDIVKPGLHYLCDQGVIITTITPWCYR